MKKVVKLVVLYAVAIAIGIGLFFAARPYALAHRVDPSCPGSEWLLIIVPAAIVAVVRCIRKDKDIFCKYTEAEDEDDE